MLGVNESFRLSSQNGIDSLYTLLKYSKQKSHSRINIILDILWPRCSPASLTPDPLAADSTRIDDWRACGQYRSASRFYSTRMEWFTDERETGIDERACILEFSREMDRTRLPLQYIPANDREQNYARFRHGSDAKCALSVGANAHAARCWRECEVTR